MRGHVQMLQQRRGSERVLGAVLHHVRRSLQADPTAVAFVVCEAIDMLAWLAFAVVA